MRQEPKMYESTKPKDAAVDSDVVEVDIAEDGFYDMVNRFFRWIARNIEFDQDNVDRGLTIAGYTCSKHELMGDPMGITGSKNRYDN